MPASSLSSSLSLALYLAASAALVATCSPMLVGVRSYACAFSASRTVAGAVDVFDSLRPGMLVTFSFASPSPDGKILLDGRNLSAAWCGGSASLRTEWELPRTALTGGVAYGLMLAGNRVEVFPLV